MKFRTKKQIETKVNNEPVDEQKMKYCWKCGSEIVYEAEICPKCGVRVMNQKVRIVKDKSRIAAALLAIFFGGLGIHKFYLGRWTGIFYLMFCWTFIPAIIGLIEGLGYLITSDEEFTREFCKVIEFN